MIYVIVLFLVLAALSAMNAHRHGMAAEHEQAGWWFYGFIVCILGLIVSCFVVFISFLKG